MPGLALSDLLGAPVVIADVHVDCRDLFALQGHDEAYQTVGAHMVGTDIQYQLFGFACPAAINASVQGLVQLRIAAGKGRQLRGPARVAFAQRMSLPVVRHENPAQIFVAVKADAEHVKNFALIPVGRRPDIGNAFEYRVGPQQRHFQAQPAGRLK